MNEQILWAKTILTAYRYLERVSNAIDKIVRKYGLNSGTYSFDFYSNNILTISQKMIDFSQRKVTLINLKVLTENILKKLKKSDLKILLERYVDGRKFKEIAERNGVSLRTVYRRLESSENAFERLLTARGYNPLKLKVMLQDEKWICGIFSHLKEKDGDFDFENFSIAKAVSM